MPTHKKGHDKDKYYHLAKDQGFRSRAAFKLIQINKRFDILSKARVLLDLCAAPGGWCQVAAKYMPTGSIILGIDLLPIRSIRNVKTIVSDITTPECRKLIAAEIQGWKADVVLCDGAPNIGAAYAKDAYVQNELVLAALKTATDHLIEGGTFCTKVYRSVDYNSIVWVLQQLFEDVQAIKPNSSRSQSSEIFLVCMKYTAPKKIDPKLLDPNHVFKEVADPGLQKVDVLHKKYDKLNKRHRTGYDESLGVLLSSKSSVSEFVESKDPVRMLTDKNVFEFTPDCERYFQHEATITEIKECFKDIRVLGKIDFKKILKWRQGMRKAFFADDGAGSVKSVKEDVVTLTEEEQILQELSEFEAKENQLQRKEKKKSRAKLAKERARLALGMSANAFEVAPDMELFAVNTSDGATDNLHDILHSIDELSENEDDDDNNDDEDEGEFGPSSTKLVQYPADELEKELEEDYKRYLARKKPTLPGPGDNLGQPLTNSEKRKRKGMTSEGIISANGAYDSSFAITEEGETRRLPADAGGLKAAVKGDITAYLELLTKGTKKKEDSIRSTKANKRTDESVDLGDDDSSDSSDDDNENGGQRGGLGLGAGADDPWFAHPLFKETVTGRQRLISAKAPGGGNEDGERISAAARAAIAELPKTDKQVRKEKRLKTQERMLRRAARKAVADEEEGASMALEIVPAVKDSKAQPDADQAAGQASVEHQALLRQGMGKVLTKAAAAASKSSKSNDDFEIVPAEEYRAHRMPRGGDGDDDDEDYGPNGRAGPLGEYAVPADDRLYDSDHEVYDSHDRTMTLALGTLMLRSSRKKALVDASYNRYAWNDPKAVPDWFMEDEMRHNKPQLPVPQALLDQIKSRFQITHTKEIKKVAEARARKRKRAATQLKTARKKANTMAESSELSGREKMKAIAKAMKGTAKTNKPSKVYVVTKKTGGASSGTKMGGNGKLKFVDKVMKKEARSIRAKKKRGKK